MHLIKVCKIQIMMNGDVHRIKVIDGKENFVKSMGWDGKLICVWENPAVDIRDAEGRLLVQVPMEVPVYDAKIIGEVLVVSTCGMPIRMYREGVCVGALSQHKPNSQQYLSPLQLAHLSPTKMVGGGCKFLSIYDCPTITSRRIGCMDKINVSAVATQQQTIICGSFSGSVYVVDPHTQSIINKVGAHTDAVTHICPFTTDHFITSGRKDNHRYLWDLRHLQTPIVKYEGKLQHNQRIGMTVYKEQLYAGSEAGCVLRYSIPSGELLSTIPVCKASPVPALAAHGSRVFFATGSRCFDGYEDDGSQVGIDEVPYDHSIGYMDIQ